MTLTFPGDPAIDSRARHNDVGHSVESSPAIAHEADIALLRSCSATESVRLILPFCLPAGTPYLPAPRSSDPRAVRAHGPLSSREAEVARLVGDGHSNRSIAWELSISVGTAERHGANIFTKLGFNRRSQLAAWVVRRELFVTGI
jgi:DNA-binding CsgD family transcriptional regulator